MRATLPVEGSVAASPAAPLSFEVKSRLAPGAATTAAQQAPAAHTPIYLFHPPCGNLEVLKWAWEHRCPWGSSACYRAAQYGNLEVLQWARDRGCEWDATTCSIGRPGRELGGAEVGARAWVPVERIHLFARRSDRHLHVLQ